MKKLLPLLFILFSTNLSAQKYAVYFTDKNNTPFSIENPEEFLSQRALERRNRHNINVVAQDLPVNPQYVSTLLSMGAKVPFTSRWLNCALVSCSQSVINQIEQLDFVSHYVYISPGAFFGKSGEGEILGKEQIFKLEREDDFKLLNIREIDEEYQYGQGYAQINQINGIPVHEQGFTGEGILIAVLDAGFNNVSTLPVFSNLFSEGRLVYAKDIVVPDGNIYSYTHSHGTNVLSCMSAYSNGSFVGTAPKASYALIRTEDDPGEYLIECYNWVVGMELADSIGADIINSSLGYHYFDDASMNYTFSQMDGESTVASFAAKCAIEKGIFVTVSAGNDNGTSWPWIGSPADAKYAASIGAVNSSGNIAYFSSIGPANATGDPKPNVCARGVSATIYSTLGNISTADGTSFSSPISCGMYACLIQANPNIHPALLRDIVDETGNRYPDHHIAYGYGIPNFATALKTVLSLGIMEIVKIEVNDSLGNNDGKLNPGETAGLHITVKNKSSETLTNMSAIISTNTPDITFINNSANFGSILPYETKTLDDAFTLILSEKAMPNSTIKFNISFTNGIKSIEGSFKIDIYGNILDFKAYAIDDFYGNGNGVLDPGETADIYVYVNNKGNEFASGVTGILSSTSDMVTINTDTYTFGNINPSQTKYAAFNITVDENAGQSDISIPFELKLADIQEKTTVINFTYSNKCNIIFELRDSYGDGWNGAALKVSFDDGTPEQTLTFTNGSSAIFTLQVAVNVNVTLSWQKGSWDNECSFVIKYESGEIIYSCLSVPASNGIFYSFTNQCSFCNPPPIHAAQYAVHFKNKDNSPYSIEKPLEYMSQRAIDRRNKYAIGITKDDLPVNPNYIESINYTGALVTASSRWSNSVLVHAEENILELINKLDFVKKTVFVKPAEGTYKKYTPHPKWVNEKYESTYISRDDFNYGNAYSQINQLNGITVHEQGYTGKGVLIAVLDAGFQNANEMWGFTHLFESGRIVLAENVVEPNKSIYDETISSHGTAVLSCMGGVIDGVYVGTAPMASYALIRTEDDSTEFLIEEYFWMMGAEIADAIGADIINSSLGYTNFDDPSMSHTYLELDGKTAITSIAAKMAVERGVFVTNSAGNNGNSSSFPWVGSPADASEVLSLGAVNLNGQIASFSSIGPNGAGYPKPDVVACGSGAYVFCQNNMICTSSGTSFASPITCGMVACIIQATPEKKPQEILNAIQKSANRYPEHDIQYGYGIPDFGKALKLLGIVSGDEIINASKLVYYPNPTTGKLRITNYELRIKDVEVFDIMGRKLNAECRMENEEWRMDLSHLFNGIYFVKVIYENNKNETFKCVISK
jgi:hypothetical protein